MDNLLLQTCFIETSYLTFGYGCTEFLLSNINLLDTLSMTKTIGINYAPSEDSDQTGPVRSESSVAKDHIFLHADSEDSDQTVWMSSLDTRHLLDYRWFDMNIVFVF